MMADDLVTLVDDAIHEALAEIIVNPPDMKWDGIEPLPPTLRMKSMVATKVAIAIIRPAVLREAADVVMNDKNAGPAYRIRTRHRVAAAILALAETGGNNEQTS